MTIFEASDETDMAPLTPRLPQPSAPSPGAAAVYGCLRPLRLSRRDGAAVLLVRRPIRCGRSAATTVEPHATANCVRPIFVRRVEELSPDPRSSGLQSGRCRRAVLRQPQARPLSADPSRPTACFGSCLADEA